jgi:hypothetical protein
MSINFKIACNVPACQWSKDLLEPLTLKELTCLKKIMGFSSGSGKEGIINYLLIAAGIREEFRVYWQDWETKDHESQKDTLISCANAYKGKVLRAKCKAIKIYAGSTKYAMSGGLVSWAISANTRGRKFLKDQQEFLAKRPKQLSLPIAI